MATVQGNEVTYELHTLGWKAFQNLCVTIVSEIWGQTVQSFFDSHDGGRDGAFQGVWGGVDGEVFEGSFTVQCKFSSKANEHIKLSDLDDELAKAERLSAEGLADNYFLLTNLRLTGTNEELIRKAFESVPGIKNFRGYGCDWLSNKIRESSKLRMLVPRVYGLGDLSQILDERAYDQAVEILGSLGDDLSKFVITNAFRRSARALDEHGFVLLLGEPACGKSTIAAALAMGALDRWGCSTIKICIPAEFSKHWNPKDPKQLFWVDDAFGATQVDWAKTFEWNNVFSHIEAAIRKGCKIIFTSRDYIYRRARESLKETALPLLRESQVVINVQELTKLEREQILYNHIKLGSQDQAFKSKIKPLLPFAVGHSKFSPESARRLGSPLFTTTLLLSKAGIEKFVAQPMDLLMEVVRTLDVDSRAALAVIFMNGGQVASPVDISPTVLQAIELLGSTRSNIRSAFAPLEGSLLIKVLEGGVYRWKYKHPTIQDAFASLVAEDSELMDIYLSGSPMDKIFGEVTCGEVGVEGVKVVVPESRYLILIGRIKGYDITQWSRKLALIRFLTYRCDKAFLVSMLKELPDFIGSLHVYSNLSSCFELDFLIRLNDEGLLGEDEYQEVVFDIHCCALNTPDSGFTSEKIRRVLGEDKYKQILEDIRSNVIPNLGNIVRDWASDFDGDGDPEDHFEDLEIAVTDFMEEFEDDPRAIESLSLALSEIAFEIENLKSEYWSEESSKSLYSSSVTSDESHEYGRSIFDDVDV